jgi:hypothetical protein
MAVATDEPVAKRMTTIEQQIDRLSDALTKLSKFGGREGEQELLRDAAGLSHNQVSRKGANNRRPAVAFLIAGMERNFESTVTSLLEQVVKPLMEGGDQKNSHIFLYLKRRSAPEAGTEQKAVDILKTVLPTSIKVVTSDISFCSESSRKCWPCNQTCFKKWAGHYESIPSLNWWATMNASVQLVLNHEQEHQMRFDRIIFARPDLAYHSALSSIAVYHPKVCIYISVHTERIAHYAQFHRFSSKMLYLKLHCLCLCCACPRRYGTRSLISSGSFPANIWTCSN